MKTRASTTNIALHPSGFVAFILSGDVTPDELKQLPKDIKSLSIAPGISLTPSTIINIPKTVVSIIYGENESLDKIPCHAFPSHLKIFHGLNIIRTNAATLNLFRPAPSNRKHALNEEDHSAHKKHEGSKDEAGYHRMDLSY